MAQVCAFSSSALRAPAKATVGPKTSAPRPARQAVVTSAWFGFGKKKEAAGATATVEPPAPAPAPAAATPVVVPPPEVVGVESTETKQVMKISESNYLAGRAAKVQQHFPTALGVTDFMQRLEIALHSYGFDGDNSIAMTNLCRDEVTITLKNKIEQVFGASFSTNGLGGVLTCGVTGMGAGLSHAPICPDTGRERYIFFSFPHISIDATGAAGPLSRPGRPGQSCACGALIKSLGELQKEGLECNCKVPGVHDALDPEYSILKQRLSRRLRYEGATEESVKELDLVSITKLAERTITDDLEYLISKSVDPAKADYAVVTGVEIHNWGTDFDAESPNLEFVAPTSVYVVINGERTFLDITKMPALTPRQIKRLAGKSKSDEVVCNAGGNTTLLEIDPPILYSTKEQRSSQKARLEGYLTLLKQEGLQAAPEPTPAWIGMVTTSATDGNSTVLDSSFTKDNEMDKIMGMLNDKYAEQSKQAHSSFDTAQQ